jgi:transketolase C-terminal domain/subunit/transketolase N-terminal domain/subunit
MAFPLPLEEYHPCALNLDQTELTAKQRDQLKANIALLRDAIIFFTALANAKGLGGHTGGAFDIVPEVLIIDGFMRSGAAIYPAYFDEAGHRVAIQYLMAALNGHIPIEKLLHYREFGHGLYGHPERADKRGIFFSSGRLGHLWSYVNGVAAAHPISAIVLFGSDGSQQEGGDAEAARFAVAQNLNLKLVIDDNDVTIAGHPSRYMPGFSVADTLKGHGLVVDSGDGEDVDALYGRIREALNTPGPMALVNRRKMAPQVPGIEGLPKGHDVIPVEFAVEYLRQKGYQQAIEMLTATKKPHHAQTFQGSSADKVKNRDNFGKFVCDILAEMPDRKQQVLVIDSDLEGSCGLHHVRKQFPEVYVNAGIMERNNFSVAAGFGAANGRQGIFGTFSAFLEMVVSEITMARLNQANVLAHFSHSGVDDMADNTCHFGINNYFADNGLVENDTTRLYYPADSRQLKAVIETVFHDPGLRFIFSTRSAVPTVLNNAGQPFFNDTYQFKPGRDDLIREGEDGYVVTYGEMLYRCLDVIEQLRQNGGPRVGLVNKASLNLIDENMLAKLGKAPFTLAVETQNLKTGLGIRLGTWLLERGYHPRYAHMGTVREGEGGLSEQIPHQGMNQADIRRKIEALLS